MLFSEDGNSLPKLWMTRKIEQKSVVENLCCCSDITSFQFRHFLMHSKVPDEELQASCYVICFCDPNLGQFSVLYVFSNFICWMVLILTLYVDKTIKIMELCLAFVVSHHFKSKSDVTKSFHDGKRIARNKKNFQDSNFE